MISVNEARKTVLSRCDVLEVVEVGIDKAAGYCLAADVYSPIDVPAFRQSSMDGYAIKSEDRHKILMIQDELPAGTSRLISLREGHTVKVFTGGPIPEGADTVVPKEQVKVKDDSIELNHPDQPPGNHLRLPGSAMQKDGLAIAGGRVLTPQSIGFLASLGICRLPVIRKPKIAILITGNEVVMPGSPLVMGQVYESNSYALKASLEEIGLTRIAISHARDDLRETAEKISIAVEENDLVLITGGVSVGDYDFVTDACRLVGITPHFHGVRQRPGKPLFFGTQGDRLVFGLPGNPASVLSCFYQYVLPAIHQLSGTKMPESSMAALKADFEKLPPLTFFLKGYYENGVASILPAQASYQLSAFADANCWIELEEEQQRFEAGSKVKIHLFR